VYQAVDKISIVWRTAQLRAKRAIACLVSNLVKRIRTEEPDEGASTRKYIKAEKSVYSPWLIYKLIITIEAPYFPAPVGILAKQASPISLFGEKLSDGFFKCRYC
jgi:hypothetical protein